MKGFISVDFLVNGAAINNASNYKLLRQTPPYLLNNRCTSVTYKLNFMILNKTLKQIKKNVIIVQRNDRKNIVAKKLFVKQKSLLSKKVIMKYQKNKSELC